MEPQKLEEHRGRIHISQPLGGSIVLQFPLVLAEVRQANGKSVLA